MTREEHLKFCAVCTNRSFDPKVGITCGLTSQVADFEVNCNTYVEDEKEVERNKKWEETLKIDTKTSINKGRIALFLIGGFYVLVGLLESFYIENHHIIFGIIDWVLAASFLGLAIWSYTKPYLALILGLVWYLLLNAFLGYFDPSTIVNGIIWKIAIIFMLLYGISASKGQEREQNSEDRDILDSEI